MLKCVVKCCCILSKCRGVLTFRATIHVRKGPHISTTQYDDVVETLNLSEMRQQPEIQISSEDDSEHFDDSSVGEEGSLSWHLKKWWLHVTFEEVMTTCEIMLDFRHNKCRKIKFGHFSDRSTTIWWSGREKGQSNRWQTVRAKHVAHSCKRGCSDCK